MIVLQVTINDKLVASAGRNDLSVLTAGITAAGVLGNKSIGTMSEKEGFRLDFHAGGLSAKSDNEQGAHFRWLDEKIKIGDEIKIRVLESNESDEPIEAQKTSKKDYEKQELKNWEHARDYYFKHKDKYE